MSHGFWILWLKATAIGVIALGLMSLAAAHPSGAVAWRFLFDLVRWSFDESATTFDADARLLNGIIGGVMVSWGILMIWLAAGPIARGDKGARRVSLIAILAWFVIDSTGSFLAETAGNIIFNVVVLVLLLAPLVALSSRRAASPNPPKH